MEYCVATDLSPAAAPAVQLALQWAQLTGATLRLVHVVHDPELAPALASDVPGDVAAARQQLEAFAATAPVPCKVDVRTAEDISAAIVTAASGASMLFVGSHGKSFLQRLRLGSVATAVLRQSHIPVVCLPPTSP